MFVSIFDLIHICKHICLHRMINHDNQIFFQEITLTCEAENEEGATASSVSLPVHCEYNYPCICLFGICLFIKGTIFCIGFLQQELCCIRVWVFFRWPRAFRGFGRTTLCNAPEGVVRQNAATKSQAGHMSGTKVALCVRSQALGWGKNTSAALTYSCFNILGKACGWSCIFLLLLLHSWQCRLQWKS